MNNISELYIQKCFELAKKWIGYASPNPMVGCVIVHKGKIIGEGYHTKFGEPHAEVEALRSVWDKSLLSKSTLYVNLEPCSHFGKTPPCDQAILSAGIRKIVIGNADPLRSGMQNLRAHNCEVEVGVCEPEGWWVNRRFFTNISKQRPYTILKWAQSADGYIGKPKVRIQISGPETHHLNHIWRSREDAVLLGKNTVVVDNPQLSCRLGQPSRQPTRVAFSQSGELPMGCHFLDQTLSTIVYNAERNHLECATSWCKVPWGPRGADMHFVMNDLLNKNIGSLITEGGTQLLNSFLLANLWDEIRVIKSPAILWSGVLAPRVAGVKMVEAQLGNDLLEVRFREDMPHLNHLGSEISSILRWDIWE